MKKLLFSVICALLIFTSCDNDQDNDDHEKSTKNSKVETPSTPVCQLSIDRKTSKVTWTAFKTTKKVPVKGVFDKFQLVTEKKTMSDIQDLIEATMFDIATASINSGNEARDKKLVEFFFGSIKDSEHIKGKVKEVTDNNIIFRLSFNGLTQDVQFKYDYSNDNLEIGGTIDLNAFQANEAVNKLNEACHDLHTGDDGVSKTWPEVDINFTTKINKKCK